MTGVVEAVVFDVAQVIVAFELLPVEDMLPWTLALFGLAAVLLLGMLATLRGNPWYALPAVWGLMGVYVRQIQSPLAGATVAALVALALAVLLVGVALKYALSAPLPRDPA